MEIRHFKGWIRCEETTDYGSWLMHGNVRGYEMAWDVDKVQFATLTTHHMARRYSASVKHCMYATYIKVYSSHLNWGARLGSLDPL
jgi:hypothetical protein